MNYHEIEDEPIPDEIVDDHENGRYMVVILIVGALAVLAAFAGWIMS